MRTHRSRRVTGLGLGLVIVLGVAELAPVAACGGRRRASCGRAARPSWHRGAPPARGCYPAPVWVHPRYPGPSGTPQGYGPAPTWATPQAGGKAMPTVGAPQAGGYPDTSAPPPAPAMEAPPGEGAGVIEPRPSGNLGGPRGGTGTRPRP